MDTSIFSNLMSESMSFHTEGFILDRVHKLAHIRDGLKLSKETHIPFLEIKLPPVDFEMLSREAEALRGRAVPYDPQNNEGLSALCIHGTAPEEVMSFENYGYESDFAAPYDWTSVAADCPGTTAWLKQLLTDGFFSSYHRVRFMWLEPGGFVSFHQNRPDGEHSLGPLTLALNHPEKCHFAFKHWGKVPFKNGSAMCLDVCNQYGEWNSSSERRLHLVIQGSYAANYYNAVAAAIGRQAIRAEEHFQSEKGKEWLRKQPVSLEYALWDYSPRSVSLDNLKQQTAMTLHFLRKNSKKRLKILRDYSLKRILEDASSSAQWCAVLLPGHIPGDNFFPAVEKAVREADTSTFMYGDVIRGSGDEAGLEEQFLLINLKKWKLLGSQNFSMSTLFGANVVERAERRCFKFTPFPQEVRESLTYSPSTETAAQDSEAVKLFTSDVYWDVEMQKDKEKLDGLCALSEGFKELFVLKEHGCGPAAKIIYFNKNQRNLDFKEFMYQHWDGKNFPAFVAQAVERFEFLESAEEVSQKWQEEVEAWGSEDSFQQSFLRAKSLPKEFIRADLLNDFSEVFARLRSCPGTDMALLYGDSFNSTAALAKHHWQTEQIRDKGFYFLAELQRFSRKYGKDIVLYGDDIVYGVKCVTAANLAAEVFS